MTMTPNSHRARHPVPSFRKEFPDNNGKTYSVFPRGRAYRTMDCRERIHGSLHFSSSDGIDSEHEGVPVAAVWKDIEYRDSVPAAILHLSGILFPVHKFHRIPYDMSRLPYNFSQFSKLQQLFRLMFFARKRLAEILIPSTELCEARTTKTLVP